MNIIGIDKFPFKWDWFNGSNVNGVREPIMFSFASDMPVGQKKSKKFGNKYSKKITNFVLSRIIFYLEDDVSKPVEFNGDTIP